MATARLALLESRLATLEAEVAQLKQQQASAVEKNGLPGDDWIDKIYGSFANDPDYDKAMELGRKYRESLRPKSRKRRLYGGYQARSQSGRT